MMLRENPGLWDLYFLKNFLGGLKEGIQANRNKKLFLPRHMPESILN